MKRTERPSAPDAAAGRRGDRALLSVVVPCFDEDAVILEAHRRLTAVLEQVPDVDFEVVYVDDGSGDRTLDLLRELQRDDPRVRVLALARNFGHEMALTAGLQHARGDAVVFIDADLQDPPEVVIEMLGRWREGVDVAYGVRVSREGESVLKRWTAHAFYALLARISDVPVPRAGIFRLMDRAVVDAVLSMPERDRFLRGMVAWTGFRQEPVPFRRAARLAGRTKWPYKKLLNLAIDGLLSFSFAPLRLATWFGFLAAGLALSGMGYALAARIFTGARVGGWAALFLAVLFLGGAQLVAAGVIGEYLARIYGEVKRRPLYLVRERLGFPAAEGRDRTAGGRRGGEDRAVPPGPAQDAARRGGEW